MVSAATPEAAEAGRIILEQGGNAIDAAVAISFALAVTEPAMSGLGGGTQLIVAPADSSPFSINGTTYSPSIVPSPLPEKLEYHHRTTIPSTVRVLGFAWERYGSGNISWAQLLEPAIGYAEEGFVIGEFRHLVYKKYESALKGGIHTDFFLMPDGNIPAWGDTLRQPVLAKTLKLLAEKGANEFYQGEMAEQIAADMQQSGGWVSLSDLNDFPEPQVYPSLNISYRQYEVYSQPPPCGGWAVLLGLKLLENYTVEELMNDDKRLPILQEVLSSAHQERKDHFIHDLESYQGEIDARLNKVNIQRVFSAGKNTFLQSESGETTHFSVMDREGMMVGVTASINAYFGAKAAHPELGFLYNSYMDDFDSSVDQDHPFAFGGSKMAYSSMSPTVIKKNGENVMVLGSPGSKRIISAVIQLSQQWMDEQTDLEELLAKPRVHAHFGDVWLEDVDGALVSQLRKEGYKLRFPTYDLRKGSLNAYFGGVHAIAKGKDDWEVAADPRRDGLGIRVE